MLRFLPQLESASKDYVVNLCNKGIAKENREGVYLLPNPVFDKEQNLACRPEGRAPKEPHGNKSGHSKIVVMKAKLFGQLILWATRFTAKAVNWRITGEEHIHECMRQGRPIIFAGWHGHNFLTMFSYYVHLRRYFKAAIMVPDNKYGMVLDHFGQRAHIQVIKVGAELGPSQWARATVSIIKLIRTGYFALLSPDGPTGPAYRVKPGIAVIAQQTKAVIIPASAASRRGVKLKRRWDEHLIPMPLARTVIHFGQPIDTHPANGPAPSSEELQERIEQALNEGARKAEELCRERRPAKGDRTA